ncbi:MAG: NHLP bacteriocin export ABC transporter permease/ATPase subunit [Anaerolineae bacterium]
MSERRDEPQTTGQDQAQELFLLRLRHKEGTLVKAGNNKPILLNDPATVWVVYRGRLDIFSVRVEGGEAVGTRHHLLRVPAGEAVMGIAPGRELERLGEPRGLIAVGDIETEVIRLRRTRLVQLAQMSEYADQVARLIDRWVIDLGLGIVREFTPRESQVLEAEATVTLPPNATAQPARGVLWVRQVSGKTEFMGHRQVQLDSAVPLPLSPDTWLKAVEESVVSGSTTRSLVHQENIWPWLDHHHQVVLQCLLLNAARDRAAEHELLKNRVQSDQDRVGEALAQVAAIMDPSFAQLARHTTRHDRLFLACELVAQALGLTLETPHAAHGGREGYDPLEAIARASRIRMRRVFLRQGWVRDDNGPLLGYLARDNQPVALLRAAQGYSLVNPATQARTPVTDAVAELVSPYAVTFYRPFPDRALHAWDLLRFGGFGSRSDLVTILALGAAGGLLSLATPLATGVIFDTLIPGGARESLMVFGLVLVVMALSAALFQLTQSIALLRFGTRLDSSIQPAIWDRLLELPVPFFRGYSSGDLAQRAMGIATIRQVLTDTVIATLLSTIFSILNLALLFYYDPTLALTGLVLILIVVGIMFAAGRSYLHYHRERIHVTGELAGLVLELLTGITKLRVAGAERRAFATWGQEYGREQALASKMTDIDIVMATFLAIWPPLATLMIFATVILASQAHLSTGSFLAFNAAFTQFLLAVLTTGGALLSALSIVPLYERARPILRTLPEVAEARKDPGELSGDIEVSHVSFRYKKDGPLVLEDVSLRIKPREFVAIVGASGSGKSTLLRLLLGFEAPEAGAILYDGKSLAGLDLRAVRRQTGVVLQNSKLISGSLFQNIVGAFPLTLQDAWQAARQVGLEAEIQQMPMGMHTFLLGEGSTLSGGQRQRLLIARAIVNKPRLILLDEATSALDNQTQALVGENLARLQATRIVIAHRLSTIINADRIYVLDHGKIVQTGNYNQLVRQPGPFAELAKRQLI